VHRLGGTLWFKTKRKAREEIEKLAKQLLTLYAKRHIATRPPHQGDPFLEQEVRASFPYRETPDQIKAVGMAALFHDLGKVNIPDKILLKTDPLTKPEQELFQLHTRYGAEIGKKAGMDKATLDAIAHHHEYLDGTGYPDHLKGDAIPLVTRIVTIANVYDNLCNHIDPLQSLTPHEALSRMYAHRRAQFDPAALTTMVKCLGVYPPGTLVRLSNEAVGLVMNVNVNKPLRPRVLVYDPEIPKDSAIILDLAEESSDLSVTASIRPGQLPRAIFDYLSPRKRVTYYFDAQQGAAAGGQSSPSKP
jgi:putative nucleotidyltransferase with HDIG domain